MQNSTPRITPCVFRSPFLIPFTMTMLQLTLAPDDCNKLQAHLFYEHYFVVTLCVCVFVFWFNSFCSVSLSLWFTCRAITFCFRSKCEHKFHNKTANKFLLRSSRMFSLQVCVCVCASNQISISALACCSHAFISCIFYRLQFTYPKHTFYREEALSEHSSTTNSNEKKNRWKKTAYKQFTPFCQLCAQMFGMCVLLFAVVVAPLFWDHHQQFFYFFFLFKYRGHSFTL